MPEQPLDYEVYLEILIEECAEVIIEASKIARFTPDGFHPDEPGVSNVERLEREIGDLEAMVDFLKHSSLRLNGAHIAIAKSKKTAKINEMHPPSTLRIR